MPILQASGAANAAPAPAVPGFAKGLEMERTTLLEALKRGPVKVYMNDGSAFVIPSLEFAVVSDIAAHVLFRDTDGKFRTHILGLVCMGRIEELESVPG
jgi:hypothetical protein